MTIYLANAFSLSMLDRETHKEEMTPLQEASFSMGVKIIPINQDDAKKFASSGFTSCVGHSDTARIFSTLLSCKVGVNRIPIKLKATDRLIVGQLTGPNGPIRLPEGATELPEGGQIEWWLVHY